MTSCLLLKFNYNSRIKRSGRIRFRVCSSFFSLAYNSEGINATIAIIAHKIRKTLPATDTISSGIKRANNVNIVINANILIKDPNLLIFSLNRVLVTVTPYLFQFFL